MKKINFLFALLCVNFYYGNSQTTVTGEFRPRFIINEGYKKPKTENEKSIQYITQRTRLNFSYKKDMLEAYISAQDIRYWGGEDNYSTSAVYGNTTSLDLNEAWFLIKPVKTLSIKVGRQIWSYDDQRIISSRSWNDYQVKYDALLFIYKDSLNQVDLGLSYNSETDKNLLYPEDKYRTFNFMRYERLINKFKISGIGIITGKSTSDTTDAIALKGTYGINSNYTFNKTKIRLTAYYQNNLDKKQEDINSYCVSFYASQKLLNGILIGAGIDYISGQDENKDGPYQKTNHMFDILYGKRHGWYGYMDYFNTIPDQGLQDYMIKTEFNTFKESKLQIDYHHFVLAASKLDATNHKINKNLGDEVDLTFIYNPFNEVNLQVGYSLYLTTSALKLLKEIEDQNINFPQFFYLMVTVKPKFI